MTDALKPYIETLTNIQSDFDNRVSELGERVRVEVIIPLCQKHNLTFTSGMGRFFFTTTSDTDFEYSWELKGKWKNLLTPVLDLLNTEVSRNQYLGYYVGDVR